MRGQTSPARPLPSRGGPKVSRGLLPPRPALTKVADGFDPPAPRPRVELPQAQRPISRTPTLLMPRTPEQSAGLAVAAAACLLATRQAPGCARAVLAGLARCLETNDPGYRRQLLVQLWEKRLLRPLGEALFHARNPVGGDRERGLLLAALDDARAGRVLGDVELSPFAVLSPEWRIIAGRLSSPLRGAMSDVDHRRVAEALSRATTDDQLEAACHGVCPDVAFGRPSLARSLFQVQQGLAARGRASALCLLSAALRTDSALQVAWATAVGLSPEALFKRLAVPAQQLAGSLDRLPRS